MRIETVHGRNLVCGHVYKADELEVGSRWAPADGTDREVEIVEINEEQITYRDPQDDLVWSKDWFSFQCRYCLIIR